MHYRLQQQASCHQETGGIVTRKSHQYNKFCWIWHTQKNNVRCLHKQAVSSVYHHQSNGQVKACIKFIKCILKKCVDSGGNINMALLQIHTTLLGNSLPSPATLMFSRQVHCIMPVLDCKPIWQDCDDNHHNKLVDRQQKSNNDASPVFASIPIGSAVVVQWEDGGLWTHGTIVGTDNHNHYDTVYTIQLTTNGRWITCNRWHIKPTLITADTYLQYHMT